MEEAEGLALLISDTALGNLALTEENKDHIKKIVLFSYPCESVYPWLNTLNATPTIRQELTRHGGLTNNKFEKNKVFLTNYKNTRMYFCSGDPELNSG